MTNQTDPENDDTIASTTMTKTAAGDETDGHDNDDQRWAEAVIASLPSRSPAARRALVEALRDGKGSMPLLGLELTSTENKRENQEPGEDSNQQTLLAPLLGTITSNIVGKARESSFGRFDSRICYDHLLHRVARTSDGNQREIAGLHPADCYLA